MAMLFEKRFIEINFNAVEDKWAVVTDPVTGARTYTAAEGAAVTIEKADGKMQTHTDIKAGSTVTVLGGDASVRML